MIGLSSHNANPPGVFDGEAVPPFDMAETRIAESVAALGRFVAEHGSFPTAESWTEAAMRPSEKTIGADSAPSERQSSGCAHLMLCGTRGARTGRARFQLGIGSSNTGIDDALNISTADARRRERAARSRP